MTNILIRNVPDDVVSAIDRKAKRLGLSRNAYLRRALEIDGVDQPAAVTIDDLERFAQRAADLDDPEVMGHAWS